MAYLEHHPTKVLIILSLFVLLIGSVLFIIQPPSSDIGQTGSWWKISQNVAHGRGYILCDHSYFPFCTTQNQITASREPVPVFIFAGIALLTRDSLIATSFIEVFLQMLVLWGIFLLTKEWASLRAAILAATIWAIYPEALRLIPQLSSDLLATVGVTYGLVFLMRARKTNRTREWLISASCLGLATMTRSAVLAIVVIIILGIGIERWQGLKNIYSWLRPIILVSLFVVAMMIPWMVRNQIELGKPVIGSSLTGYNIYRHNYMLTSSNYFRYVGSDEGSQAVRSLISHRPDLLGTENEAQMDTIYRQEGLKIIRSNPDKYILLSMYRFFPLWFNWQVSESYGTPTDIKDYAIMVFQGFLLFLSIFAIRGQMKQTWPLWASILVTCLEYMAIEAQLRYLLPVMPLVISLSSAASLYLIDKIISLRVKSAE